MESDLGPESRTRPRDAVLFAGGASVTTVAYGLGGVLTKPVPPEELLAIGLPAMLVALAFVRRWS